MPYPVSAVRNKGTNVDVPVPIQLGAVYWVRADFETYQNTAGTTPATADGDSVQLWKDKIGSGVNVQQSTSSKVPVLKTGANGINGKPAIFFDGGDILRAAVTNFRSADTEGTLYMVLKVPDVTLGQFVSILGSRDEVGSANVMLFYPYFANASPNILIESRNGGGDTDDKIKGTTTTVANNTTYIMVWKTDGSQYIFRVNGVAQSIGVVAGSNTGDWFGDITGRVNLTIGGSISTGDAPYCASYVAEVGVFPTNLTGSNLTTLETYLNSRYAAF